MSALMGEATLWQWGNVKKQTPHTPLHRPTTTSEHSRRQGFPHLHTSSSSGLRLTHTGISFLSLISAQKTLALVVLMGTLVGHVVPGLGYLLIGLWHLYNHIKLHCQHPKSYCLPCWFPAPRVKHLELYFIIFGAGTYVGTELFLGPSHHHPLDTADWTIPTTHLHNFEHVTITLGLLVYAVFALHFDLVQARDARTLSLLIGSVAFAMEFLTFYLHSTDHSGVEWQYHWLLQTAIAVSLATTVLGIGFPRSFAVGFARSVSVVFQGVWFNVLGVMLYTPRFIPKGCSLVSDDGMLRVPCDGHESLHRAKALVNLQYAWSLVAVVIFSTWFHLHLANKYPEVQEYECLGKKEGEEDEFPESPKKKLEKDHESPSCVYMGKCFHPMDLER